MEPRIALNTMQRSEAARTKKYGKKAAGMFESGDYETRADMSIFNAEDIESHTDMPV